MSRLNPCFSVDCVVFGFEDSRLKALLIERDGSVSGSDTGVMALPGNLIFEDEDLDDAALRVLFELTTLTDIYLQQFQTFGDPNRISKEEDIIWLRSIREIPDVRVITVAYYSLVNIANYEANPGGFARSTRWVDIQDIPPLAFDHNKILESALDRLREDIRRKPLVFELLPPLFTLAELQSIYEVLLQHDIDKRNFRRKAQSMEYIEETSSKQSGVAHKPARLFRFNKAHFDLSNTTLI